MTQNECNKCVFKLKYCNNLVMNLRCSDFIRFAKNESHHQEKII